MHPRVLPFRATISVLALAASLTACTSRTNEPAAALPASAAPLARRGEQVYRSICISCHNVDPRKVGTIGPAIAGSSEALVEARLLRGSYPPGYHPQRPGNQMPLYPQLATEVQALAAYLQSFTPTGKSAPSPAATNLPQTAK